MDNRQKQKITTVMRQQGHPNIAEVAKQDDATILREWQKSRNDESANVMKSLGYKEQVAKDLMDL